MKFGVIIFRWFDFNFQGKFSSSPTVFATAEHYRSGMKHDAASLWLEDLSASSFKICIRELQNFAGVHDDISVVSALHFLWVLKVVRLFSQSLDPWEWCFWILTIQFPPKNRQILQILHLYFRFFVYCCLFIIIIIIIIITIIISFLWESVNNWNFLQRIALSL